MPSHLTFQVQIDESSKRFLIHSSMGRLDKLRELHPGMNILRTLSHWNELQKRPRRLNVGDHNDATEATVIVRGGVLGIAPEQIEAQNQFLHQLSRRLDAGLPEDWTDDK